MLVSAVLITMVVGAVYGLCLLAKDTYATVSIQGHMQREAMLGIESMFYGVDDDRRGLHEAVSYGIIGNTHISYTGTDGLTREFYQSDDKVIYEDAGNNATDLISGDVASLVFSAPEDNLIVINLQLQRDYFGDAIAVNFITSGELRNR